MINRQDCILLLTELKDQGVDVKQQFNEVFSTEKLPAVLKFINNKQQLDLVAFYDKLRKSYNQKKSKLYINIMKDIEEPTEVLTTLAALQLQILLFAKTLDDSRVFIRSSRVLEISKVLNNYYTTYDLTNCLKLLQLIKADLKVSEWVNNRIK